MFAVLHTELCKKKKAIQQKSSVQSISDAKGPKIGKQSKCLQLSARLLLLLFTFQSAPSSRLVLLPQLKPVYSGFFKVKKKTYP